MEGDKEIKYLNLDDILPNRFQPRIQFNDKNINELADSIKEHGVIQPIVVRKISDKYEIIAGERRYKASILAGKTTIPAIITNLDDKNSAEVALIENIQRQDLTPIEEAISYKKILDMGYINQTELAEKLGKTQSTIANKLRLLNLSDEVQEALLESKISERHARSLLKLDNSNQINMLNRIIAERLTVRKTDEEVDKLLNESSNGTQKEYSSLNVESVDSMNENIKNEFNIPTNPIFNDESEIIEPITSNEINNFDINTNQINPGFMDINKIESDAEDIFVEQEPADMDSLLRAVEPIVENNEMAQVPEFTPQVEESQQSSGKFFNMFNFNKESENPNFVNNIEEKELNMDFGFNNISNDSNYEIETLSTSIDSNNSFYDKTDIIENNNEISGLENEELFSSVNSYHLNDDSEFTTQIPVQEINSALSNESISTNPISDNDEYEQQEKFVTPNFKTVVNTIRECMSTIEKYGYEVDLDEMDLNDTYQVIFRIKK